MAPKIAVLSGVSGSGKTTACARVAALGQAKGLRVAGILSPPRESGGAKAGIDVEDIVSRMRRPLATSLAVPGSYVAAQEGASRGPRFGMWQFDAGTLAWGRQLLAAATPCDVLVIDEIGPLELLRDEGWPNALEVLEDGGYALAVVGVRPWLVETLGGRLAGARLWALPLDRSNRDAVPGEILDEL